LVLRIGKKAEICAKKEIRERVGLKPNGKVYDTVPGRKLHLRSC